MSKNDFRAQLIRYFTLAGGVYFFVYFLLPESLLGWIKGSYGIDVKGNHDQISQGFIAVGAMAIGLGLFNLIAAHGGRVVFKKPGWINSVALLGGLAAMISATAGSWITGVETAYTIRKLQTVADFASHLADRSSPERKEVEARAPQRSIEERVSLLAQAARGELAAVESYTTRDVALTNSGRHVLLGEVKSGLEEARSAVDELSHVAPAGSTEAESLRTSSVAINKLAGSYAALLRFDAERTLIRRIYTFLYEGLFNPLGSAMFALLGVYIAAAAYRAFRIKTVESALMMTAALIVMLGQISLGQAISDHLPALRQWLLEVPNSAAFRAIRLGTAVGGLMLAIRMWLSIESGSFTGGKKQ